MNWSNFFCTFFFRGWGKWGQMLLAIVVSLSIITISIHRYLLFQSGVERIVNFHYGISGSLFIFAHNFFKLSLDFNQTQLKIFRKLSSSQ